MYALGIIGIFSNNFAIKTVAILALAHEMIIADYMLHYCAHNTVFKNTHSNAKLGTVLTWLCGYGTYEDIRFKHFRHDVDSVDIVWFDYVAFFTLHRWLFQIIKALE